MAQINKLIDYLYECLGEDTEYTVYGRPPGNVSLKYPCVIITEDSSRIKHASDKIYLKRKRYSITVITRDETDETYDMLEEKIEYCKYENRFISDNLYHYKLVLYY